ncbi:DODA-type extradiol aromatic ring-opening family dioxygenase [Cupriavidus basilensis]|uniref:Dioxygenase n=1 Tax=Cupriavidus basilensis TaxID=68895 RepID=A0A643FT99_9BURK|nr:class III extradiol ring-cleavage dioxygenase [Cupriavidus basilensis]QOT79386.1 dioxygenase [Cupriavidus basilensis]
MTTPALPTFFISHGGGPWPWMEDQMGGRYDKLKAALQQMPRLVQRTGIAPKAVLMISAHWEEPEFTVMANPKPPMIYDYYGFPDYTYQIQYAAPGAPQLAARVQGLLEKAGLAARLDPLRGFDHGMFAPMAAIYPEADMPTVQLSLKRGLDPQTHLALGRALAPLRHEGILVVGSGLSYHNLRAFGPAGKAPSAAFDAWLQQALTTTTPAQRTAALAGWESAPAARQAHPREEHLLPLMVAVGAAEDDIATRVYHEADFAGGITVSSFMFGGS